MVWSHFDLAVDPWREFGRWESELSRIFDCFGRRPSIDFPPVNVWKSDDGVILTAELPGISPDKLDISVMKDTVTLRGTREVEASAEGKTFHRRERGGGSFVRSVQLPHDVDAAQVRASYEKGILRVELPRAEEQKPKRITVK